MVRVQCFTWTRVRRFSSHESRHHFRASTRSRASILQTETPPRSSTRHFHPTRRKKSPAAKPHLKEEETRRKMLRVSEEGNRRRDVSVAKYSQLRQSLLDLQQAADRIFDTISQRAAEEREKLENLSTRISKAKGKIDAMSRSNQSMTIISPSRYPSKSAGEEDYRPLFSYKDGSARAGFPVGKLLLNGGLHREFGIDGTLELFQFFSETACESLPKEVHSKASDGFTHSRGNAYSEYLIEPPKFPNSSFLVEDRTASDSSLKPKHQALPPPPPSLLLHNSRSLPGPESFSFKPAVKQLQSLKLPDILPDLPMVSNRAFGGINSLSKASEHRSPETSSSTLVAGKVAIHPSSGLHGDCGQEEKMDSTVRSRKAIPCLRILPTPPPLPPSLAAASPTEKLHLSGNSGSTSTQVDKSQLIPSLPVVDVPCDPGIQEAVEATDYVELGEDADEYLQYTGEQDY